MIELQSERFEAVQQMLGNLSGSEMRSAFANAANRAMSTARSTSWKAVKEMYTVTRTAFYHDTKTHIGRADTGSLEASLSFKSLLIPLVDFKTKGGTSRKGSHSSPLRAEVIRGTEKTLKYAYAANLGTYGEAVFERLTPKRESSSEFYGPAAAQMVYNPNVLEQMDDAAMDTFERRLEHELDRILRG